MKKIVLIITVALALCFLAAFNQAQAATTDTITVWVSMAETISVSVDPNTWNIGIIELDAFQTQGFLATNDGNVTEDFYIRGTDAVGGWALAPTPGTDQFSVNIADISSKLSTTLQLLATNNAPSDSVNFTLEYTAPSGDTKGGGVDQSFSVYVSASKSP